MVAAFSLAYLMTNELTISERMTAANALRIAANVYESDAKRAFELAHNERVAQQFQRQAFEARDLAEKLENN